MRPSEAIMHHRAAILEIASRYGVSNVRVFGSTARQCDGEESDIDLLVDPSATTSLFDIVGLQQEAEALTGVIFDVQTPLSLSQRFRDEVLRDAVPL